MWHSLLKRANCVHNDQVNTCDTYASVFLTTGVPIIISFSLFFILGIILFVIVRRKRRERHAQEAAKNREIDDDIGDVELVITAPRNPEKTYRHWEAQGRERSQSPDFDLNDPFEREYGQRNSRIGMAGGRDISPMKQY